MIVSCVQRQTKRLIKDKLFEQHIKERIIINLFLFYLSMREKTSLEVIELVKT